MARKKRATVAEMLERKRREVEILEAKAAGTWTGGDETDIQKRLRNALRKRLTALGNAKMLFTGRPATVNSPAMNPIDEKIARAEQQLQSLYKTRQRAEGRIVNLPFDIERLETLLKNAESGQDVSFPDDLTPLDEPKSTEEIETAFATARERGEHDD